MANKGGAWKVAYADFITAMMALFMVLWIVGAEQDLLDQLQEYFRNPPSPWERQTGRSLVEAGDEDRILISDNPSSYFDSGLPSLLESLAEEFYRRLQIDPRDADPAPVDIAVTSDGLRLVVFDRKNQPLFEPASDRLTEWGTFLVQNLAWLISRHEFRVVVDGHSSPAEEGDESDRREELWNLSTDRAQVVRRTLQHYAVDPMGIERVSGYGDTRPYEGSEEDATHQRVTISLSLTGPVVFKDPVFE